MTNDSLQGKSYTLGYDTAFSKFQDFRNDAEKRYKDTKVEKYQHFLFNYLSIF